MAMGRALSALSRAQEKVAVDKSARESSSEPNTQTSKLQNYEKVCICGLSHQVYGILLWQPKLTDTVAFKLLLKVCCLQDGPAFHPS